MHTLTDLDCEKYRHPDTARARRMDTYADHGVSEVERADLADHLTRWMPYLHSVVEASQRLRGGERLGIGGDDWEVLHTPGHSLGHVCLYSPAAGCCSPVTTCWGRSPRRSRSSGASTPTRWAATWSRCGVITDRRPEFVLPGHGRPFGDAVGRIDAILRNKLRRLEEIRRPSPTGPVTVTEVADTLVAKAILAFQRQMAMDETLAHIAYLRWSGVVERRTRPDGVYEWYATSDAPLDVTAQAS